MDTEPTEFASAGREMHSLAAELFPICRSVAGPGVRETLRRLSSEIPLKICEVPSGTKVFDWEVPNEWQLHDAFIDDSHGNRIVDFRHSNLHVVNGSLPINQTLRWSELKHHLHTLPDQPDLIPYRTCFHQDDWGFSLTHAQFIELDAAGECDYHVCIDAEISAGSLSYGELFLPGESDREVLLTTHVCHPSLANDNLSGLAVLTQLGKWLGTAPRYYSYRLLFIPATIGAITWLCLNEHLVDRIEHGLVLALLGDSSSCSYRKCRREDAEINRVAAHVIQHAGGGARVLDFEPYGYDQRQFCSPRFDLPIGCLMRAVNGQFPEYHTSADNMEFIHPEYLADSLDKCLQIVRVLEGNRTYVNQNPKCEPRLDKHGLYRAFGSAEDRIRFQQAVQWVLNLSDGNHSLLSISERSNRSFGEICRAADALVACGLIAPGPAPRHRPIRD
jgi:aminopeptidase-like protein